MADKKAAVAKGLVRSLVRAGVFGGAAYGGGSAIVGMRSSRRRKSERSEVPARAAVVGAGAAVLPRAVDLLERAALRVVKIAVEKDAAPRYVLPILAKAVRRVERDTSVIERAVDILKGKRRVRARPKQRRVSRVKVAETVALAMRRAALRA